MSIQESVTRLSFHDVWNMALFLAGLPLLAVVIVQLIRRRGVGPTVDGAWPNVCWGRLTAGLPFVVAIIVLHIFLQYVLFYGVRLLWFPDGMKHLDSATSLVVSSTVMCIQWALLCGLILYWLLYVAGAKPATLGLTFQRLPAALKIAPVMLLTAMPAIIAFLAGSDFVWRLVKGPSPGHPVLVALTEGPDLWQVVALFVMAGLVIPFFEELFFRGFIQTSLMRTGSPAAAIIAQGVLFGLVHMALPTSVVSLTIFGMALGYAFYRTRSLVSCFLMHAAFNLMNLTLTVLPGILQGGR